MAQQTRRGRRACHTHLDVIVRTSRPETPTPDVDAGVHLLKTDLKAFNDLLQAYADFDVHPGDLSLFSKLTIRHKPVTGYLKPIFTGVDVYAPDKGAEKAWTKTVFEPVIGDIVELLNNPSQDQVARTQA